MPPPSAVHTALPIVLGARRVGASLRTCAAAARVPWPTFTLWLRRGRAAIRAEEQGEEVDDADRPYAHFAREVDHCSAQHEQVLRSRALKGSEEDPRLAWDMVKWLDGERARREERRLMRARARVEEQRAAGELVERQRVEGVGVRVYLPEES